jgi:hypothetical protein
MTTPLGIRTVWKSLFAVAIIALAGGLWLAWPAPAPRDFYRPPKPSRASEDCQSLLRVEGELTTADILVGMRPMTMLVQACYERYHAPGLANVEVEISPEGIVTKAIDHDSFAGTPTGACIATAVRHATFRPSKAGANINYPFMLR